MGLRVIHDDGPGRALGERAAPDRRAAARVKQAAAERDDYRAALIAYAKAPEHRRAKAWEKVLRTRAAVRSQPLRLKPPQIRRREVR